MLPAENEIELECKATESPACHLHEGKVFLRGNKSKIQVQTLEMPVPGGARVLLHDDSSQSQLPWKVDLKAWHLTEVLPKTLPSPRIPRNVSTRSW